MAKTFIRLLHESPDSEVIAGVERALESAGATFSYEHDGEASEWTIDLGADEAVEAVGNAHALFSFETVDEIMDDSDDEDETE